MKHEILVEIGNSDDKLTQSDWSKFVERTNSLIARHSETIYFYGSSSTIAPWQNAAWHFSVADWDTVCTLREGLDYLRFFYKQDSIAWSATIPHWIIDNPIQM